MLTKSSVCMSMQVQLKIKLVIISFKNMVHFVT